MFSVLLLGKRGTASVHLRILHKFFQIGVTKASVLLCSENNEPRVGRGCSKRAQLCFASSPSSSSSLNGVFYDPPTHTPPPFHFWFLVIIFFFWATNFEFSLFFCFSLFLGVDVFSLRRPATGFPHPWGQAHPFQGLSLVFLRALLIKNIFTQECSVYYFWANEVLRQYI